MFCTRGMYYKDFSRINESIINKDINTDDYKIWCVDDEMVIVHRRNKTKNRVSSPMYIRIDNNWADAKKLHILYFLLWLSCTGDILSILYQLNKYLHFRINSVV